MAEEEYQVVKVSEMRVGDVVLMQVDFTDSKLQTWAPTEIVEIRLGRPYYYSAWDGCNKTQADLANPDNYFRIRKRKEEHNEWGQVSP